MGGVTWAKRPSDRGHTFDQLLEMSAKSDEQSKEQKLYTAVKKAQIAEMVVKRDPMLEEAPAHEMHMGVWTILMYTEEQQARLACTMHNARPTSIHLMNTHLRYATCCRRDWESTGRAKARQLNHRGLPRCTQSDTHYPVPRTGVLAISDMLTNSNDGR